MCAKAACQFLVVNGVQGVFGKVPSATLLGSVPHFVHPQGTLIMLVAASVHEYSCIQFRTNSWWRYKSGMYGVVAASENHWVHLSTNLKMHTS